MSTIFRYFPRDAMKTAEIRHYPTAAGKQDYPAEEDEIAFGAFVRMTAYQRALMGGDQKFKYMFFVDEETDIRESDLLTIDDTDYKVANVDEYQYGSMNHKAAILTISTNASSS